MSNAAMYWWAKLALAVVIVILAGVPIAVAAAAPWHRCDLSCKIKQELKDVIKPERDGRSGRDGRERGNRRAATPAPAPPRPARDRDGLPLSPVRARDDGHLAWKEYRHEEGCDVWDKLLYFVRHYDGKPRSLRHLYGCRLYRADADYHRTFPGAFRSASIRPISRPPAPALNLGARSGARRPVRGALVASVGTRAGIAPGALAYGRAGGAS